MIRLDTENDFWRMFMLHKMKSGWVQLGIADLRFEKVYVLREATKQIG